MGLGCGEGGWQSKSLQRHTCTCGQVTGKHTAFPLPLYNSKLSYGERESTAAEPALQESRFVLKTRWLWTRLSLQETSMWRKNTWISYSKGGLGKKWQTPRMQGFKIFRRSAWQGSPAGSLQRARAGFVTLAAGKKGEEYSMTFWHWRLNHTTEVTVQVWCM